MNYITQVLMCVAIACSTLSCTKQNQYTVASPDQNISVVFSVDDGIPVYQIAYKEQRLIDKSKLGLRFKSLPALDGHFEIIKAQVSSVNTVWEQPWGEFKTVTDHHNELSIDLRENSNEQRQLTIVFRVFNDGVGFRYIIPAQEQLDSVVIAEELTEFTFAEQPNVWWAPVHAENSYYESFYRKNKLSETDTINTPATFETTGGVHVAIHEANLTDYASMTLRKTSDKTMQAELVPWSNGDKVYAVAPFQSPWRTIVIADNPGGLATSTLMLNLNEPCAIEDVSWIEPSKYIGIWWGMHLEKFTWGQGPKHGATTQNVKQYIDFAAKHGFNGVLVEGWNKGWDGDWPSNGQQFSFTEAYPDFDLEEVCLYAAQNNVRLIGHHETAGAVSNYEAQLEEAFELYQKHAVNAVKTGYVNKFLDGKEWHDGQFGVRHYRKVIETAARYQLMIDNHEPVKGTGLQRTYPNLMTQEGARGQEYDAWSADGGNPPSHTTVLPFTRMLAGPFDFTPGTFDFDYVTPNKARVQTTLAKQLALYVVIYSPQQMASDLPENYEGKAAFQFIKDVPVNWSDTKVLDASIGEYVVTARKDWDSEDWYVGAITNEASRTITIDLAFLQPGITYQARIYRDGQAAHYQLNPYPVEIESQEVQSTSRLSLNLAPGGGAAIQLVALNRGGVPE